MPRWTLLVAFLLGLLPGMVLYWTSRATVTPVTQPAAPPASSSVKPEPVPVEPETEKKDVQPTAGSRRGSTAIFDAAELNRMLAERSHQLEAAQGAQADLTRQLRELEGKVELLVQEEGRRKALEAELRDQLTSVQREAESAKTTAQSRETALRELESVTQQLRKQVAEAGQSRNRRAQARTELEELARRRDGYLNNILGRYREATDLFRTMSLRLDNPRDAGSPLNNDLSRIQQAIQLAEEDLRQLRVLNAQAARLQKELN
jgi:chromosome segregation ATPase